MAADDSTALPDLAEIVGGLLARVPREQRPLFIALAERMAAERYRGWAGETAVGDRAAEILACAEREETIARNVEGLHPDARKIQDELLAQYPELVEMNRSIFADRPLEDQFEIQARGERIGATTWRAFAAGSTDPSVRDTYLACAELEEESADLLESIVEKTKQ